MKTEILSVIALFLIIAMLIPMAGCSINTGIADDSNEYTDSLPDDTDKPKGTEKKPAESEKKPSGTEPPPSLTKAYYNLCLDKKNFKYYGRMQFTVDGVTCDFTVSGIEFSGTMKGPVWLTLACSAPTYFTVYVDGVRSSTRFYADQNIEKIKVADFSNEGIHTVRILKQSEAQRSIAELKDIEITGSLNAAPANKTKYIQVIGDSITCGYGNLTVNGTADAGAAIYEDGTQAFPFMTAERLGADVSVIGCSGVGVDKGWTSFSEMEFYTRACRYRSTTVEHDFTTDRTPDLVIINLGTNDHAKGSTEDGFKTKAKELINFIRTKYGSDVPIIWTTNMMGNCCESWVKAVISEMNGEANNLYTLQLNKDTGGGATHPTVSGHTTASEQLALFISTKKLLG